MKEYNLLHFGIGNVGKAFVRQLQKNKESFRKHFDVNFRYAGFFSSKGGVIIPDWFSEGKIKGILAQVISGVDPKSFGQRYYAKPVDFLNQSGGFFRDAIVIDTTSSGELYPFMEQSMERGASLVVANKRLLTGSMVEWKKLHSFGTKRFLHETTVGAGLPVINSLKSLLATGDEIVEISGCMSGTLGFICASLEEGMLFSESVKKAKELGYTEFDPRADLSGLDVVRKSLILARLLGQSKELKDIQVESFYPSELANVSVDEFMAKVNQLDEIYKGKMKKAQRKGNTLRYVARVTKTDCKVNLQEVSMQSSMGSLKGADNIFVFKTKRYFDNPLIVRGPGAGPEVTAAGVMADVLAMVGVL